LEVMGLIRAALSPKEHEQDDDWDGNAEQPEESASTETHGLSSEVVALTIRKHPGWFHRDLDERLHESSSAVKVLYQPDRVKG
jgi:hypothetical protein